MVAAALKQANETSNSASKAASSEGWQVFTTSSGTPNDQNFVHHHPAHGSGGRGVQVVQIDRTGSRPRKVKRGTRKKKEKGKCVVMYDERTQWRLKGTFESSRITYIFSSKAG